jgi:hypothetical protein
VVVAQKQRVLKMTEKSVDGVTEQIFNIQCVGRTPEGGGVMMQPVDVRVRVYNRAGSNILHHDVTCPYITGGHGQRCKASHPEVDKDEEGVDCPYSVDLH